MTPVLPEARGGVAQARRPTLARPATPAIGGRRAKLPTAAKLLLPNFTTVSFSGALVQSTSSLYLGGASYTGALGSAAVAESVSITDAPRRKWMLQAEANRDGSEGSPYPAYEIGLSPWGRAANFNAAGNGVSMETPPDSCRMFIGNGTTFNFSVGTRSDRRAAGDGWALCRTMYNENATENRTRIAFGNGYTHNDSPGCSWGYAGRVFRLLHVGRRIVECRGSTDGGASWTLIHRGTWDSMPDQLWPYALFRSNNDGWRDIRLWIGT